jgi:hypothetical protein
MHQTQTNEKRKQNERTNASHKTNARYMNEMKRKYTEKANARYTKRTHDTRTNHWSVTIYYPMTNDPGSIEVQYSIVLLFE